MKSLALGGLVMILVCGGFVVYLVGVAREDLHIREAYRESRCTVLGVKTHFTESADATPPHRAGTWWSAFTVRYDTPSGSVTSVAKHTMATAIDGTEGFPKVAPGFPIGTQVPCWFDPAATKDVVLQIPDRRTLFLPLIPMVGVAVGFMALRQAYRNRHVSS